jgi:hypothetical protein
LTHPGGEASLGAPVMECPRCRAQNREGRRFCAECAAPLAASCPSCGFSNEPGEKFCGGCAAALTAVTRVAEPRFAAPQAYTPKHLAEKILTSRSAVEGERKQVTVLFADLKGSMELLADRDPEEARKLLDPVLERMMEAVHRFEGTVNQVMGDGIMALFGTPLAHEDHAVRACYAALRMQQSVTRYAEEVHRTEGVPIQIRVGLNSGDVVVRSIGSDLRMDLSGQMDKAREAAQQALEASTTLGYSLGIGRAHQVLGRVAQARGAIAEAEEHLEDALEVFVSVHSRFETGRTQLFLASCARARGGHEAAATRVKAAHTVFKAVRAPK